MRLWRILRAAYLVLAALTVGLTMYGRWPPSRRRRYVKNWSRRLLKCVGIRFKMHGFLPEGQHHNLLVVANHVSWLDIFVLNAVHPARFVAKSELAAWPVAGYLMRFAGTIFVERARRHDTGRVNKVISDALAGGDCIGVFPEGTTTDGRSVQRFHGSLLQPVIDAGGQLQPITLRYHDAQGRHAEAAEYIGDTTFLQSFWRIVGARGLMVEAWLHPLIPAQGVNRRELAGAAHSAISQGLERAVGGSAPERPPHPPAAAP